MSTDNKTTVPESSILFFDGECPACNRFIAWLANHGSSAEELRFAPLQGSAGQAILRRLDRSTKYFDSIILLRRGQLFENRAAFIALGQMHAGRVRWLAILRWIPEKLVALVYHALGSRRHLWGHICQMPTAPIRERLGLSTTLEREVVSWASLPDNTASSRSGSAVADSKPLGPVPKN